jgi:hypothetical protein
MFSELRYNYAKDAGMKERKSLCSVSYNCPILPRLQQADNFR